MTDYNIDFLIAGLVFLIFLLIQGVSQSLCKPSN